MQQARMLIVALTIFCLCTYIFGDTTSTMYEQTYNPPGYNPSQYNSLQQEENVTDSEKEDNSIDNVFRDYGPLTICANSATYESDKGRLTYYGDVFVMQIHHKHILCKKPEYEKKGVIYFTRDKKLSFKELQKKWYEHAKELCVNERECNFISGQKLIMQLDKDKKVKTLTMESSGDERSQFYSFPTGSNKDYQDSKKITRGPLNGTAKKVIYNVVKRDLELYSKAIVNQNENQYRGNKIVYDMNHDLVSIPGSVNRRSRIILDGVERETKIDTGLTPISDYSSSNNTSNINNTLNNPNSNPALQA